MVYWVQKLPKAHKESVKPKDNLTRTRRDLKKTII